MAKSKLNSIETLASQALIDLEISNEEFKTIVNEKEKYEKLKESITMTKSDDENDELYIYIYISLGFKCLSCMIYLMSKSNQY